MFNVQCHLSYNSRRLSLISIGEALRKVRERTFMVHSHKIKDLKFTYVFLFQGQYRRLDRFQEDVFAVLEKAREISRSDSEVSWQ